MRKLRLKSAAFLLFSAILVCITLFSISLIKDNTEKSILKATNSDERIYIIDAGHGGEDGGAVASDGTVEKELNLDVSLKLDYIMRIFGFKTIMTRITDTSVGDNSLSSLRERKKSDIKTRAALLESTDNGVLISVHQNMFSVAKYSGAQIFYSENNPESKVLAEHIRKGIVDLLQPANERAIKPSGDNIYILYHAKKPAVMVECGFLSNQQELDSLKKDSYRRSLAFSVFCGIYEYDSINSNTLIS